MTLEVHEAFERELRTLVNGEWAVLAGLKPMMLEIQTSAVAALLGDLL